MKGYGICTKVGERDKVFKYFLLSTKKEKPYFLLINLSSLDMHPKLTDLTKRS